MKKRCLFLCAVIFLLTVCGCSSSDGADPSETSLPTGIVTVDTGIIKFPADITGVSDFKCVCSINDGESFVIDGDQAKELYTVIAEAYRQSEKTEFSICDGDLLYLSFQSGETNSENPNDYYGCFSLFKNDDLSFSAAPMISFAEIFKMPEGTYAQVLEMVGR